MPSQAVDRFFDLIKGGKSPVEAQEEAQLADDELDRLVLVFAEFCDSERFTTSHYDAALARRVRHLEEALVKRDEFITHELSTLAKTHLELIKSVNRLVDVHKPPKYCVEMNGKVVQFPQPPAAG